MAILLNLVKSSKLELSNAIGPGGLKNSIFHSIDCSFLTSHTAYRSLQTNTSVTMPLHSLHSLLTPDSSSGPRMWARVRIPLLTPYYASFKAVNRERL